jgi:hypothetical protein
MHEIFLLGSHFQFLYFLVVEEENSGTYMFLIDIPFKGCQGRSNRSSNVHAVSYFACGVNDTAYTVHVVSLMHAVSLTQHAFFFFCIASPFCRWFSPFKVVRKFYCACGVNDTTCTTHPVSMTPHAFKKIRISSQIRLYIQKGLLIRDPGRMF